MASDVIRSDAAEGEGEQRDDDNAEEEEWDEEEEGRRAAGNEGVANVVEVFPSEKPAPDEEEVEDTAKR